MKDSLKSFRRGAPPMIGARVEVLCAHGDRVEVAPFLCCWTEEGWVVAGTRRRLQWEIIGWRHPSKPPR